MQMLNTRLFIRITGLCLLISTSISVCLANTSFLQQFQVKSTIDNSLADRITEYYSEDITLPLAEQRAELLNIGSQLDALEKSHSDKAVYWFIRGLHHRNIASYYAEAKNKTLSNSHLNNKNNAYKKAIEQRKTSDNQLSASIFNTMKHGLPQDLKIKAIQNELALGGNGESDSDYWYLHWSNIDQLEKAGRKQEALAAYNKMQKELKNSDMDMSIYNSLTTKIKNQTLKNINTKNTEKKQNTTKKNHSKKKQESVKIYEKKYVIIISVVSLSAFIIIAVAIYEIRQKRKKIVKRMTS
ncbi:MAG: hypothetical protein DIZ80_04800 [endosymbiont of Galathealinum brachiosum]|uniref:Uncharacterized protein n=1 Tax=endosymbiont of Galathealinum brachiosum TaxID=2200906 RepID=A0A370DIN4_9GAMM|nr:MAG: hypothetical protein DIZ80_04800 [endosymbiont of Galathealinum brachiosum]